MAQENRSGVRSYKAAADLEQHRRVKRDGSGNLVYAGLGEESEGTLEDKVLTNNHGAVRLWNSPGTRFVVAAGAFNAGASLYGAANGKVDDVASGTLLGYALQAASGDGSIVEMVPASNQSPGSGKVYANTADSAAGGTGSNAEFDFDKDFTFPAGDLKTGDILDIEAEVTTPATHTTDTLTLKLYVGTEVIVATAAVDVANGDVGHIKARVIVREGGATGKLEATGTQALGVPGTVTAKPFRKAEAAEDLSGAIKVKVTGQFSVADAGNSAVLEHLSIVRHR